MKTSRSLSACLLALAALPVLSFSQDVKKDEPAAAGATQPGVIDVLKTGDLTYGELIDFLRIKGGANLIVSPVLQNEMVPQMELHNVTAKGVLEAICAVTGLEWTYDNDGDTVVWHLTPPRDNTKQNPEAGWRVASSGKICRVFKASATGKLTAPQLNQLLANISDAALNICKVEARAQGRHTVEPPIIEAHAGTGLVIVAGTEDDVQLVGQVIQAMGGEVVPLTTSVTTLTLDGGRIIAKDAEGTRKPIELMGGTLRMTSPAHSGATKELDGKPGQLEVNPVVTTGVGTNPGSPGGTADVVELARQLEAAREQANNLQKQLDLLRQHLPSASPAPPAPK
jgi:hypothetical protein